MADLIDRPRSRGQILLVTALVLGVSFVALALILNSAIFTENLASRGDTTGADEVVTYQNNLQDGIEKVVDYETRNATDDDTEVDVYGRILTGISDADNITVRRHAKRGATSNVSIVDSNNGTRIYQTDSSRNLTNANAESDWTVAEDVSRTRDFRFNLTGYSGSDQFVVSVDNGSTAWEMRMVNSGSDIEVTNASGITQTCSGGASPPDQLDVTAGTYNGTLCDGLGFEDVPDGPYSIDFENGSELTGTYSLVVDNRSISSGTHFGTSDDPTFAPVVYNLTVEYYYRTSDIVVGKEFRVAPGDPDGR